MKWSVQIDDCITQIPQVYPIVRQSVRVTRILRIRLYCPEYGEEKRTPNPRIKILKSREAPPSTRQSRLPSRLSQLISA